MKKPDTSEQVLSRRKALGRIGLFATAAYTIPAFTTISMVHASSGASSGASSDTSGASSGTSAASEPSPASEPSVCSEPSGGSEPGVCSEPSGPSPSEVEKVCGVENLDTSTTEGAEYEQCLISNGWEGFVQPVETST